MTTPSEDLLNATSLGDADAVHWILLNTDADVNASSCHDGLSPLHIAAALGRDDIISLLLHTRRCDIDKQNDFGCTPLHYASANGHHSTVQLLLSAGANVGALSEECEAPVGYAANPAVADTLEAEAELNSVVSGFGGICLMRG
eukprot:gnl/Spiro4/16428_TR8828_c0_g1_i1.p1 gnl/Spiro4/16428_TR8828_c0_g1~~gnl/Spiro4/16428_TR8828_c0_g1_i1.p1  ORF type:complete len:156 (-),score=44.84 gnl/Spiro4/16428_TR8828_c0_g1_i1:203-634(-)